MSYTYFVENTLASGSEVQENFEHIAQGDRLPLSGSAMSAVTDTYDLGDTVTSWETCFCNELEFGGSITSDGRLFTLIGRVRITASTASIQFTGLNGDETNGEPYFRLVGHILVDKTTTSLTVQLDQASVGTYGNVSFQMTGSTEYSQVFRSIGVAYILAADGNYWPAIYPGMMRVEIYAPSDKPKMVLSSALATRLGEDPVDTYQIWSSYILDDEHTITSITITPGAFYFRTNTVIELWGGR